MAARRIYFRAEAQTVEALDKLAEAFDRDRSYLINRALEAYVEVYRWQVDHIARAKAEADAGRPFIAHEDVESRGRSYRGKKTKPPRTGIRKKPRAKK
jgi:predicted transcriptional regulator